MAVQVGVCLSLHRVRHTLHGSEAKCGCHVGRMWLPRMVACMQCVTLPRRRAVARAHAGDIHAAARREPQAGQPQRAPDGPAVWRSAQRRRACPPFPLTCRRPMGIFHRDPDPASAGASSGAKKGGRARGGLFGSFRGRAQAPGDVQRSSDSEGDSNAGLMAAAAGEMARLEATNAQLLADNRELTLR